MGVVLNVSIVSILMMDIALGSQTTIGQVLWVKGGLKAVQANTPQRVLTRRSAVFEKDTLVTDAKGSGEIIFIDDSLLSLRENTTLEIAKYQYGKGSSSAQDSTILNLTKGGFRTITGIISKENPKGYQANTPVATIAVRGTQYSLYYTPGQGQNGMVAELEKGVIEISNAGGKVILKKCVASELKNKSCNDQTYAHVTSATTAPTIVNKVPTEFINNVKVISSLWSLTNLTNTGGGASGGGVVSGFCIK
jgi:FecR-like protein